MSASLTEDKYIILLFGNIGAENVDVANVCLCAAAAVAAAACQTTVVHTMNSFISHCIRVDAKRCCLLSSRHSQRFHVARCRRVGERYVPSSATSNMQKDCFSGCRLFFFLLLFRFQCCGASCQSNLEHGECHRRRARAQSGEYCLRWMTGHLLYGIGGAKNSQASAWLCVLMNGPHRLYRWYWLLCVGLCLLLSNFIAHRQLKITVIDNYRHLFLFCGCLSDWEKCAVTER